jgi:hypothetical protein
MRAACRLTLATLISHQAAAMSSVETVRSTIKQIASSKDNVRLSILAYVVWIAAMAWIFWLPLPSARTQTDVFGYSRVVACLTFIQRYDTCAHVMNLIAAGVALMLRAGIVFLTPPALVLLAIAGAAGLKRIRDGHDENPNPH